MRAFLIARWAPLTAAIATVAYAVTVIGFGLNYRPLHNDEGVTLSVASRPSARDVLDVAIDDRHGPPLHYLAVHASLVLRILGDLVVWPEARRWGGLLNAIAMLLFAVVTFVAARGGQSATASPRQTPTPRPAQAG